MIFILHDDICFDPEGLFLENINTRERILLPATAAYILSVLIENESKVTERDVFFDEIWKRYGVEISGNTLNQYISLLRKNLKLLGVMDDIIITMPRVGFCLSCDVKKKETRVNSSPAPKKDRRKGMVLLFCAAIAVFFIFAVALKFESGSSVPESEFVYAGTIGKCDVFMPKTLVMLGEKQSMDEAKRFLKPSLSCEDNVFYIFDSSITTPWKGNRRYFISRCIKSPNNESVVACSEVLEDD